MIINRLNVGAYGIEPPADIFRLKWLIVVVIRCHFAPLKRSPILTDKTLIIMNNKFKSFPALIHHLLRGFAADVRPHGKPTTKLNLANITNIINTRVAKGRIELPCSEAFEPWRTLQGAAPTFTG